jgi:CheY-like chemotaxis protein/HPt (histidine-containing phosphotransfer) domain-containing protein
MGGTLDVTSEPGVGSTFSMSLELPLALPSSAAAASSLDGVGARVFCRRQNLQRAIVAQLQAWSVRVATPDDSPLDTPAEQVWLVDAETYDAAEVSAALLDWPGARPALIILARPKQLIDLDARGYPSPFEVVAKPLQRASLFNALAAATKRTPLPLTATADAAAAPPLALLNGHVLLVEDNPVNALIAESMLQELGCTVAVATDGALAVARASSENFDVILMDRHMPEMDGVAATNLIRAAHRSDQRRTPIIALTADTSPHQQEECRAAGMDSFLGKPLGLRELHAALTHYLPTRERGVALESVAEPSTHSAIDPRVLDLVRELDGPEDRGLVAKLVSMYLGDSVAQTNAIAQAAAAGDWLALGRDAHSLKSASANVGAIDVARLAGLLEELAQKPDAVRAGALARELVAAHRHATECLQPYTATPATRRRVG